MPQFGAPRFEMEIDRGLGDVPAGAVCDAHGDDDSLHAWIHAHASETSCSYCDRTGNAPFAADLRRFTEHVFRSLLLEYGGADDEGIPYDSGEGGYLAPTVHLYDMLVDEGVAHDDALIGDLVRAWEGQPWVRRDVWWLSDGEALRYGWEHFEKVVKTERRYWFELAEENRYEPSAVPPARMLPEVGRAIEDAELLRAVGSGTRFARAHTHVPSAVLKGAERLGSPPTGKAAANRMSPGGISIFYGAEDPVTAVAEVRGAETDPARSEVTVAEFEATRELLLVDLVDLPPYPGLFDEARAHARSVLEFLGTFTARVSETVVRDGREHVEYVPTQVFAEWLRFELRPGGRCVDGLRYRSAQADGVCVALFCGHGSAAEPGEEPGKDQPLRLVR